MAIPNDTGRLPFPGNGDATRNSQVPETQVYPACVNSVLELPTDRFGTVPGNRPITLETVTDLLSSMRVERQLVPGLGYADPDRPGYWICLAGNRRLFCCRILGMPFRFLPVEGEITPARMLKLSITDNQIRRNLSQLELGEQIEQYAAQTGISSQSELAEALNLSQPEVSKALALPKKLAPDLHGYCRDQVVGRTFAELIASVPEHDKQRTLMQWVVEAKPRREHLERRVAELKGKKQAQDKPLKLKFRGAEMVVQKPTVEAIQGFLDAVGAGLKKVSKESLPLSVLPSLLGKS